MGPIDRYAYFNKLTHVNPMLKMGVGIFFLLLSLITEQIVVQIAILVVTGFLVVGVARVPVKGYLQLYKLPLSFLLLSILTVLVSIQIGGPGEGLHIGGFSFVIRPESKHMALHLFFRAISCISSSYFIALTVPMNQQVQVFYRCHFPIVFIEMMVMMYRFINIFLEELHTMQDAMELRLGRKTLSSTIRSLSLLGTGIFYRVMDSYEDWKNVLEVKNYQGTFYFER